MDQLALTLTPFPGWEPLLKEYNVDMYISAHVHNYERFLPIFNGTSHPKWRANPNRIEHPDAPVHVVTGAAGNVEDCSSPLLMAPIRTNAAPWMWRTRKGLTPR